MSTFKKVIGAPFFVAFIGICLGVLLWYALPPINAGESRKAYDKFVKAHTGDFKEAKIGQQLEIHPLVRLEYGGRPVADRTIRLWTPAPKGSKHFFPFYGDTEPSHGAFYGVVDLEEQFGIGACLVVKEATPEKILYQVRFK